MPTQTTIYLTHIQQEDRLARLSTPQQEKLARLMELLLAGQARTNLTAIKEPAAIVRHHFADSLFALDAGDYLHTEQRAADIGTGAGFPLFPLAIMTPQCQWTAVESVGKKVKFIEETTGELALDNITALHSRAEEVGRGELRGTFDAVTARAVGPLISLCEVGLPLLRVNGVLLLYKTESALPELDQSKTALETLGGKPEPPFRYRLEGDVQDRMIFVIRKSVETSETYPRLPGVPFKKPLT